MPTEFGLISFIMPEVRKTLNIDISGCVINIIIKSYKYVEASGNVIALA